MQLSDGNAIRKCVVYVGYQSRSKTFVRGTAFFVHHRGFKYLVTAKHNILKAKEKANALTIRFNKKSAGISMFETPFTAWQQHEDPFTDVAVMTITDEIEKYEMDVATYPAGHHVNEKTIRDMPITVGDEVFFPGLFDQHAGEERNVPVVRSGNIAAMAEERVRIKWFGTRALIDAYLVEARSLGGLSGSPVFVHFPWRRRYEAHGGKKIIKIVAKETEHNILGLVHGHYDERVFVKGTRKQQHVNVGMAIVVPFTKVMDLLKT